MRFKSYPTTTDCTLTCNNEIKKQTKSTAVSQGTQSWYLTRRRAAEAAAAGRAKLWGQRAVSKHVSATKAPAVHSETAHQATTTKGWGSFAGLSSNLNSPQDIHTLLPILHKLLLSTKYIFSDLSAAPCCNV